MPKNPPELIDFGQERIRTLHFTWIAFFITFYVWFNMAPLATTMLRELGGEGGWLTKDHIKVLAVCNVALTIPARVFIGALLDRYGSRRVFSVLLIVMSIPTFAFAFGNSFVQLLIARLLLSIIGAGFVIGIRMVAQWFPPNMIGRAEGFYAGWGNFGSAAAAMTLPWIALHILGDYESGWRYAMALNGVVTLAYGFIYFAIVRDVPRGETFVGTSRTAPMLLSSRVDLVQYLVWSAPMMGALGLLAWRVSRITVGDGDSSDPIISTTTLWIIWAILAAVYGAHVVKTLQTNLPHLRQGIPDAERFSFNNVAALNATYFANFGAELAVVSMLPAFFEGTFALSPSVAGLVASSFAFVNLFARPLGGLISDSLSNRKLVMVGYMVGITMGFLGMAFIGEAWPLWLAVTLTIATSMFVQGADVCHHPDGQSPHDRSGGWYGRGLWQRRGGRLPCSLIHGRSAHVLFDPRVGRSSRRCLLRDFPQRAKGSFRGKLRICRDGIRESARLDKDMTGISRHTNRTQERTSECAHHWKANWSATSSGLQQLRSIVRRYNSNVDV